MKRPKAPRRLHKNDFKAALSPGEYTAIKRWYWAWGVVWGAGGLLLVEVLAGLFGR